MTPAAILAAEIGPTGDRLILVAGGDGHNIVATAARIRHATPLFHVDASTPTAAAFSCPLTWPAVVQLVHEFGPGWVPGPKLTAWTAEQAELSSADWHADPAYVPTGRKPYSWQAEAQVKIATMRRVFLFDEPGAGKTGSALLGLEEAGAWPALVFCPASMVDTWVTEAGIWVPHRTAKAYRGTGRKVMKAHDLLVASFDTGKRDAEWLLKRDLAGFVVDELHLISNADTDRAKASRKIARKVPTFVGLGGTPITHNVGDLHTALKCLTPEAWEDKERWVKRFCLTEWTDYGEQIAGLTPYREPEFRLCLAGRERRVAKADVLAELPDKVYSTRHVDMTAAARKVYNAMEADMLAELTTADQEGEQRSVMDQLTQLLRLNQLASASADIWTEPKVDKTTGEVMVNPVTGEPLEVMRVALKAPSWKVDALLEVMEERPGSPVVAFAPSRQLMTIAGDAAEAAGYRVGYVWGEQTAKTRTAFVDAFQRGELDLLCVTTGAGGVGLTLTAANTAVFLQRPWSYVEASQAEDRLHRPGAEVHDSIEIIDVVTRQSVDSKVREVLQGKAANLSDLMKDPRIAQSLFRKAKT